MARGEGLVHVIDLWERPFVGPLTELQAADVEAANKSVSMLGETVNAAGDAEAKAAYDNAYFNNVPGVKGANNAAASWGQSLPFKEQRPSAIRFYEGISRWGKPGSWVVKSCTMRVRGGDALLLYLAAHELGHAVLQCTRQDTTERESGEFIWLESDPALSEGHG